MGGAPADRLHAEIDQRRPDRSTDVIAAGRDCDRKPAVAVKPVRGFRHQRAEGRRRGQADSEMHQDELPDRRGQPGADIAQAQNADADADRGNDAVTVGDFTGDHLAQTETKHDHGEGERRRAPVGAELGLDHGKRDHHRPHADATERADQDCDDKPGPGSARVWNEQFGLMGDLRRNIHGGRNLLGYWHNVKPQCRDIGHADVREHGQRPARNNPAARQAVRTPPRSMPSCSAKHPVRRGLSIQS